MTRHAYFSSGSPIPVRLRRWLPLLIAALLLSLAIVPHAQASARRSSAAPSATRTALPGSFEPAPCPIEPIDGLRIDCGYLTVAESRSNFSTSGKTIRLAVAILRSPSTNPRPDPAVFLQGGPGLPTLMTAAYVASAYAPVLAERDIVLFDQRGTGYSQPSLTCPFGGSANPRTALSRMQRSDQPALLREQVNKLIACGAEMRRAGIDLRAYNSAESAADLEDLRRALGYETWNLLAGSYGTRLALTAMRYRPETIRSAVLDSPYPPQVSFHTGVFPAFDTALTRLFAECRADAACSRAYPDLERTFEQTVARLNQQPAPVTLRDEQDRPYATIRLTGNDLLQLIYVYMYESTFITQIPQLIQSAAQENYQPAIDLLTPLLAPLPLSMGMQLAVQCNEDATFSTARDFVAARHAHPRVSALALSSFIEEAINFNEALLEICDAWGLSTPDPSANDPVVSDVPSLLIGGQLDPITPPENVALTARTLSRSTALFYPRGGHWPSFSSPCLSATIAAFLNTPTQQPDSSCIAREAPLPFVLPESSTR
jgi:pimeloyl-ACP methyl ester carboxylesterase